MEIVYIIIMTTPIAKFRVKINKLIKDLRDHCNYEQLKELEKVKITVDLGMTANPEGSISLFMTYIEPYADQILTEDENFFLTGELKYDEHCDPMLISKLRSWWPSLPEDCRDNIKKSIKLLLMLGSLATENQKLLNIINSYRDVDNPLSF
jgi:hypothetical protein